MVRGRGTVPGCVTRRPATRCRWDERARVHYAHGGSGVSRAFDDASSQYLEFAGAVVSAAPLTMACWFKCDDATVNQILMCIGDKDIVGAAGEYFTLEANGAVAGDPISAVSRSVAHGRAAANTSAGFTAGAWCHAAAVIASSTSRSAYLDGGSKTSDATSVTPTGLDTTGCGRLIRVTYAAYVSGLIAWPCIWSVALSDAEVAALAAGAFPPSIQPASIVDLWDLTRNVSPETPLPGWGSHNLTVNGATFSTDNPPVAWPSAAFRRRAFGIWSPGRG